MLALQTRQSLSTTALSLASQADQAVLSFLRLVAQTEIALRNGAIWPRFFLTLLRPALGNYSISEHFQVSEFTH